MYDALVRLDAATAPASVARVRDAATQVASTKARVVLQLLKSLGVVKEGRGSKVQLLQPQLSGGALDEMAARYKERHAGDREKLDRMMEYGQTARCRWALVLEYFGEKAEWERCGTCDNCRNPLEEQIAPPRDRTEAAERPSG